VRGLVRRGSGAGRHDRHDHNHRLQLGERLEPTQSDCLRGLHAQERCPKFPDPDGAGRLRVQGDDGIDPESAQFEAAAKACQRLAPTALSAAQQAEFREELLAFSACMRENGVPNFPDPQFERDGSGGIAIDPGSGIDEDSPQFKDAEKACEKRFPADPSSRAGESGTP
jgi:hypothetical protein